LDPKFSHIATIGRVKLVYKEVKDEEARKLKVSDEQKRVKQLSTIEIQDSLPLWPKGKSVKESLSNNVASIFTLAEIIRGVHQNNDPLTNGLENIRSGIINTKGKGDPFWDYRQNLMAISTYYDAGHRLLFLDIEKMRDRIIIVMHSIRMETNGSPLFYIEWGHNLPSPVAQMLMDRYKGAGTIQTTLDEQKIWLVELQRSIRKGFHCEHKLLQRGCIISPKSVQLSEEMKMKDMKMHSSLDAKLCGHCRGRGSFSCSR
jgi:hypothetical protein